MSLGVLGGMLKGGGSGIRENARRNLDEKERKRQEQLEDDKYNARIASEREDRDKHYAQVREDAISDREAKEAHDLKLAKLRNKNASQNSKSNTLLANRIKSFEAQGAKYLEGIDKINGDSLMTPEQKLAASAPLFARLDELVENNPGMGELSPLYGSFYSSAKNFISQFEQPTPETSPSQTASRSNSEFVIPIKRDSGNAALTEGLTASEIVNRANSEPAPDVSGFNAERYNSQVNPSVLGRMQGNSRQNELLDLYGMFPNKK
ncbi:hypothetical protein ACPV5U_08500 [Vibrio mediterranei]